MIISLFSEPARLLTMLLFEELKIKGYHDLKPAYAQVFQFLESEGSRITELALKAGITKQSMSKLVYDLEKAGYLKRYKDKDDKRAVIFRLSAKGEKLYKLSDQILREIISSWKNPQHKNRFDELRALLK